MKKSKKEKVEEVLNLSKAFYKQTKLFKNQHCPDEFIKIAA